MSQSPPGSRSPSPVPFLDSDDDDKGYVHAGVANIFDKEEIPETPSPRTLLQPGDVRRLVLLIRHSDLNGQCVVLETYDQAKNRWNVLILGTQRRIAVKDTNLAPGSPSPSPIPGPKGPIGMFPSPSPIGSGKSSPDPIAAIEEHLASGGHYGQVSSSDDEGYDEFEDNEPLADRQKRLQQNKRPRE